MTRVVWRVALAVALLSGAPGVVAQPASPAPLRNLVDDQVVRSIVYCRGEYALVMASGTQHRYPELNLRFKTDASRLAPTRASRRCSRPGCAAIGPRSSSPGSRTSSGSWSSGAS
jgi:hypothetical protein